MSGAAGCTLAEYAQATGLAAEKLAALGLRDVKRHGRPAVAVPYHDRTNAYCLAPPSGALAAGWERPTAGGLYGVGVLSAKPEPLVVVVGEIEAQTLRCHGIAAIGIPPEEAWAAAWSELLADVRQLVFALPSGHPSAVDWLTQLPSPDHIRVLSLPTESTINQLHRGGAGTFTLAWNALIDTAQPLSALVAEQRAAERRELRTACGDLLASERLLDRFVEQLQQLGFAGPTRLPKLLFLAMVSRLLAQPVSIAVKGTSSVGKSFVVKQVLRFFSPEAYYEITAMSDRALVYSHEPLRHRVLVLFESGGLSEVAELMVRSLLSEGRILYDTVIEMQPVHIEREGPTALITTTTRVALHPENETRFLSDTVADTPERISEVLRVIAAAQDREPADLIEWHALDRLLAARPTAVYIPYAGSLAESVTSTSVRMQRDFSVVLNLIRAHTLLHQHHRDTDEQGRILASLEDYSQVRDIVEDILAETAEVKVPPTVAETTRALYAMQARPDGKGVTTAEVAFHLKIDRTSASRRLRHAASLGFISELTGTNTGRTKHWVIGERLLDHVRETRVLPTPADLAHVCRRARTARGDLPEEHPS